MPTARPVASTAVTGLAGLAVFTAAHLPPAIAAADGAANNGPWVVRAGTKATGEVTVTGKALPDPRISSKKIDFVTQGGLELGCTDARATGLVHLGKSRTGKKLAEIKTTKWIGCVGPAGLQVSVIQQGIWNIDAVGAPGTVTTGEVTGVKAKIIDTQTHGQQCSGVISGTLGGNVNTKTQSLDTTGSSLSGSKPLTFSNVKGCFGLIANGETAKLYGKVQLSNTVGKLSVKAK